MEEEWRTVVDWPYEVSNLGRVRRAFGSALARNTAPGRLLTAFAARDGYLRVTFRATPRSKVFSVHRLVATTFLGAPPSPKHEVAHSDGTRTNNVLTNLRWVTSRENHADTIRHGRSPRGTRHGGHKLTEPDVLYIRRAHAAGEATQVQLAARFGVSQSMVSNVVRRAFWSWL